MGGGDTVLFYQDSQVIYQTLYESPQKYLTLTIAPNATEKPELIADEVSKMGYWWNTSSYMVVRFNALVSLLSFGSLYVHSIFMAFLSFIGLTALYKAASKVNFDFPKLLLISVFLIPSVLFWTSGVHKEGLLIFSIGVLMYHITQLTTNGFSIKSGLILVLMAAMTYFTRDFVLFLLLPGLAAYLIGRFKPGWSWAIFLLIYIVCTLAGAFLPIFDGGKTYLAMIAERQNEFQLLGSGNTHISISKFEPTLASLLTYLPEAIFNSMISPVLLKFDSWPHAMAKLESILILISLAVSLFLIDLKKLLKSPFQLWVLSFTISLLLLIGFIVPNIGAIIRYRSIALPFLFVGLIGLISESRPQQIRRKGK